MKTKLNFFFIISILALSNFSFAQTKESFIRLKSGETLIGKVEYLDPFLRSSYILYNDSIQYTLDKIQAYQTEDGYYSRVKGSYKNFVKRTMKGKIDLYTETITYSSPGYMHSVSTPGGTMSFWQPGSSSSMDFDYFSKDSSEIIEATYSNLL